MNTLNRSQNRAPEAPNSAHRQGHYLKLTSHLMPLVQPVGGISDSGYTEKVIQIKT